MDYNIQEQVSTKFVEVPSSLPMNDKIMFLNTFLNDIQRNGFSILSVSDLTRQELSDGGFEEGFIIEYREVST